MLETPRPRHKRRFVFDVHYSKFGGGNYCWALWDEIAPGSRGILMSRHGFKTAAEAQADIANFRAMVKPAAVELPQKRRGKR